MRAKSNMLKTVTQQRKWLKPKGFRRHKTPLPKINERNISTESHDIKNKKVL